MTEAFVVRRCALPGVEAVEAVSARSFARHSHDAYAIGRMLGGAHIPGTGTSSTFDTTTGRLTYSETESTGSGIAFTKLAYDKAATSRRRSKANSRSAS